MGRETNKVGKAISHDIAQEVIHFEKKASLNSKLSQELMPVTKNVIIAAVIIGTIKVAALDGSFLMSIVFLFTFLARSNGENQE